MNIFIRTNFNNLVGLGHIKRSTRLATELKNRGHDCFFYLDNFNSNIKINFKSYFIYSNKKKYFDEIEDAKSFLSITKKNQPGIVIVDDYRIGIKWEKYVSKYHKKIVVFDDLETKKHYADFIVNYNPRNYPIIKYDFKKNKKKKCNFLIHPKFNIISRKNKKFKINNNSFHITFYIGGGNDQKIIYQLISEILKKNKNNKIKLIVIIGPLAKNIKSIMNLSKKNKSLKYIYKSNDISGTIKNSKIFIGTSGTAIFETAFYGVPSILIEMSKNQNSDIFLLEKLGHYFFLNMKEFLDYKKFSDLILLAIKNYSRFKLFNIRPEIKIDNKGSKRVVDSIFSNKKNINLNFVKKKNYIKKVNLSIRPVNDEDINHYLFCRNLQINQKNSVKKKLITSLEHYNWWFKNKRKSYVLLRNGEKVLYFYEEKIISYTKKNYTLSGWFACSKDCSIKEILFALNWQRYNAKPNTNWISFIKKSNKFSIKLSKYIGWKQIDIRDKFISKLKNILKINEKNFIFYER